MLNPSVSAERRGKVVDRLSACVEDEQRAVRRYGIVSRVSTVGILGGWFVGMLTWTLSWPDRVIWTVVFPTFLVSFPFMAAMKLMGQRVRDTDELLRLRATESPDVVRGLPAGGAGEHERRDPLPVVEAVRGAMGLAPEDRLAFARVMWAYAVEVTEPVPAGSAAVLVQLEEAIRHYARQVSP